jgi:hypothetical protein
MDLGDLSKLIRRPDLLTRQVGLDLVLFDPKAEQLHVLDPIASSIWNHITPDRTFKNIVEAIGMSFTNQSKDIIISDVENMLREFRKLNLLISPSEMESTSASTKKPGVVIPDAAIEPFTGYSSPTIKTYPVSELAKKIDINKVSVGFADWLG